MKLLSRNSFNKLKGPRSLLELLIYNKFDVRVEALCNILIFTFTFQSKLLYEFAYFRNSGHMAIRKS